MNEQEARDLWDRMTPQEIHEIAYHALVDRYMRDADSANQEAVRRGTVGAGVLPESASNAAKARQQLHDSIDRAIARAKEARDSAHAQVTSTDDQGVLTDGVTSNLDENQQSGGERSALQTSANDGGASDR